MASTTLTAVVFALSSRPSVAALDHVSACISSFLDASVVIPLASACSFGSIRLLDRIWESSSSEGSESGASWSLSQFLRTDVHYYRFQFSKSLRAAAARGDLDVVQWLLGHFSGCTADVEVVEEAARCGRRDVLELLLEYEARGEQDETERNVVMWGGDDVANAVKAGHGGLARWLYESTPGAERNLNRVMELAVRQGDMSLIQWLLDEVYTAECHLPMPSMNDAAAGGHMEILQWIFEQDYGGNSDYALEGAAKNGRLDMVQWLVLKGVTKGAREAVQVACGEGHLPVVRWLLERKLVQYPHFAVGCAIREGHLDVVKYLHEVGISYQPSRMLIDAASCGQLGVVKWLCDKFDRGSLFSASHGALSDNSAMDRAAGNGHWHVLEFLYSIAVSMRMTGQSGGPTCSEWALSSACALGHVEIAKWVHREFPHLRFQPSTTSMVARNGKLEVLQWLHSLPDVEWSTDVMDSAAENGHLEVVKWLHANRREGCTANAINYAAREGHLPIMRWLHSNCAKGFTADVMDFAVDCEYFDVLLFLRAQQIGGCSAAAKLFARDHRQTHILEWLEEHYPD
ncbi:unnamed protein product [Phytophthora fragariaefolia]|uniref:Unnamed protein product n=1 Tax=Phytophthora fragariaefolia TaxID=1490495 RepID=A0A9W6TQ22_9STRA|nr:unnamed protein product [Phytophthora fragariaefolia]